MVRSYSCVIRVDGAFFPLGPSHLLWYHQFCLAITRNEHGTIDAVNTSHDFQPMLGR